MSETPRICYVMAGALFACIAGCGTPRTPGLALREGPRDFSSCRIQDSSTAAVRPAAARAFRQYFQVDEELSGPTVLIARAAELSGRGDSPQLRDRIAVTPSRQRQVAALRLRQEGPNVLVLVTVQNQRMITTERATFSPRADDRPSETPMDRAGLNAAERGEEWTNVGRDRGIEQAILNSIEQQFATTQPE